MGIRVRSTKNRKTLLSDEKCNPSKKIAIVGAGYWGRNLVRVFKDLGVLSIVCDRDKKLIKNISKEYRVKATTNFDEILTDKEIDAIVISVPATLHFELALKALTSGKHVFVEKPLALNYQEGRRLVELAKSKNLILMVGHILHYHPAVIKLKQLIRDGELGRLYYIYSTRVNIGKIRKEENILWSFAPHDISVILSINNEIPQAVFAKGGNYLHNDIADVTISILDFPNGVKSHLFVSWLHPYKEQKLVVVGDKKMAVFDDLAPAKEKLLLYHHQIHYKDNMPILAKREPTRVAFQMKEPLKEECKYFLDCIERHRLPLTDGEEGLRVLRVLESCEESLSKGGEVIYLRTNSNPRGKDIFIHPSSYVDEDVRISKETKIWHFSHILKGSRIGERCNIGQNVVIGPNVIIGNNVKIQNNVSIYKGITLEDDVFCGPAVVFTNVFNPRSEISRMNELRSTLVKRGATLGANSTIVCGCTIGKYAFVGAAAVATKNVPDYALVYGNPARQQGWICECGIKLEFKNKKGKCNYCGKKYQKSKSIVSRIRD